LSKMDPWIVLENNRIHQDLKLTPEEDQKLAVKMRKQNLMTNPVETIIITQTLVIIKYQIRETTMNLVTRMKMRPLHKQRRLKRLLIPKE
uniref:Transposase n=1 Tax=Hymenolepis diminuta TaxID=6216 RepID=A0A0R3SYS9_HYMDI